MKEIENITIKDVERLDWKEGDTLVFSLNENIGDYEYSRLNDHLVEFFQEKCKILLLPDNLNLDKIVSGKEES